MADPYAATRSRLMAQILEQVAAGEPLRDVCGRPGMPSDATVRNWRRSDAAFSAALDGALAEGRWRRKWAFDEAKAEAFLSRYRAGEHVHEILRDPTMFNRRVYDHWRATQAPFCAEVERLKAVKEPHRTRGIRIKPHMTVFDPVAADRIVARVMRGAYLREVLASDPAMPTTIVLARWRREQPEFDRVLRGAIAAAQSRHPRARRRREAVEDLIAAGVEAGETLYGLGRRRDLPTPETLYRWMREQPAFAARIEAAREARRGRQGRRANRQRIMAAARRRMAELGRRGRRTKPEA